MGACRLAQRYYVKCFTALIVASVALFSSFPCAAQNSKPTGLGDQEILRERQRVDALRQTNEQSAEARNSQATDQAALKPLPKSEQPCFVLNKISLSGDQAQQFQWAIGAANFGAGSVPDPAIGRCLGTEGVQIVSNRIQNAIFSRGYIVAMRVTDLRSFRDNGELDLVVIPATIRQITIKNMSGRKSSSWNSLAFATRRVVNIRDVDQTYENYERVPTADTNIRFIPSGASEVLVEDEAVRAAGQTDVLITRVQRFPIRLSIGLDDAGSKATGRDQLAGTVSIDNPLGLNDLAYISLNQGLGEKHPKIGGNSGFVAYYSLPYRYWQFAVTGSRHSYQQAVVGLTHTYIYSGTSDDFDATASRVVYRDAVRKTRATVHVWTRSSRNFIDDAEVDVQRRKMAGWQVDLSHIEHLTTTASLSAEVSYRQGTGWFRALPAPEEPFGEGTARGGILSATVALGKPFQFFKFQLHYNGVFRGQWNSTPLVPQDRFAIGSRYTVRGFDGENLLSADRGFLLRNDVSLPIKSKSDSWQAVYVGVDAGAVSGKSSKYLAGRTLSGAVVGLRGGVKRLSYDVFVGAPVLKPKRFQSGNVVTGFNVNVNF